MIVGDVENGIQRAGVHHPDRWLPLHLQIRCTHHCMNCSLLTVAVEQREYVLTCQTVNKQPDPLHVRATYELYVAQAELLLTLQKSRLCLLSFVDVRSEAS